MDGGNGALSVADVIQARRYAASLDQRAEAAGPNDALPYSPKPVPGKRSSLLPREVKPVSLYRDGTKVIIGVDIEAQGDEAAIGFALNFDTAVLSSPSLIELGPDASGAVLTVNDSQAASGKLGIAIDKAPGSPFAAGTRRVLYVAFEVAPVHPDTTNISFVSDPVITEVVDGTATPLSTVFSAADISLLAPTAANASIEGTVTRANGSGLSGATVVLGGVQGSRRSVLTNGFGRFRFDDVTVGETYTIDVRAKGLMFRSRLITVTEDVTGLEIGPEP
ncbi:MAG: carboxypeptidase regulatory-like domain-containing protein [Chloracidobacterium sp.]|nr:carboxypeptidase regulatory-like domain-containing protein [Chloracidobacterium sp.]